GGHAIARDDAGLAQSTRDRARPRPQLAPGPFAERPQLRGMPNGDFRVLPVAKDVRRVAQPCTREPLRAGHLAAREHPFVRLTRVHLAELPDRGPEILEPVDRPLPEVAVVLEIEAARLVQPLAVARDRRGRD